MKNPMIMKAKGTLLMLVLVINLTISQDALMPNRPFGSRIANHFNYATSDDSPLLKMV